MSSRTMMIVSVVLGLVAVIVVQLSVGPKRGEDVVVFRASADRDAGDTLGEAVEKTTIPAESFEAMKTQVPTAELEGFVRNSQLVRPIKKGTTVTFLHLSKTSDAGLGAMLEKGKRAVAIEVDGARAVGFVVRPGDRVDVLGTFPRTMVEAQGRPAMSARFVLQNTRVLAVGRSYRLEDPSFLTSEPFSTVTLEVTPEEAQKLEAVRGFVQNGFTLALRSPEDKDILSANDSVEFGSDRFEAIGNRK